MIKNKRKNKDLTILAILTLITIFTWIGFDIFRVFKKPASLKVPSEQLKKVNFDFDQKTLESLKKRKIIDQNQLNSVPEMTEFSLEAKNQPKGKNASPAASQPASPSAENH